MIELSSSGQRKAALTIFANRALTIGPTTDKEKRVKPKEFNWKKTGSKEK